MELGHRDCRNVFVTDGRTIDRLHHRKVKQKVVAENLNGAIRLRHGNATDGFVGQITIR